MKSFPVQVHLGPVAVQDDSCVVANQRYQRLATAKAPENGERLGNRDPQPGLLAFLLGGRFIEAQLGLFGQVVAKSFVGASGGTGN